MKSFKVKLNQILGGTLKYIFFVTFFSFSLLSNAYNENINSLMLGPISSGGGMGVVCRDSFGKIKSVELLDLWEAKSLYGRNIKPSKKTIKEIAFAGLDNLKNSIDTDEYSLGIDISSPDFIGSDAFYEILKYDLNAFLDEGKFRKIRRLKGIELTLTNDSFEVIKPVDCEIKQLVRYIDNVVGGEVIINQDLLDKMDNLNLAALYLHEVFYAHLRRFNEQSSIRVRRTIGQIFSGHTFKKWDSFLPSTYYKCENQANKVYIYHDGHGITYAVSNVDGRKLIGSPEPSMWLITDNLENGIEDVSKTFDLGSFGTLGETGYDFSYRLFAYINKTNEVEATLELINAPDFFLPQQDIVMKCTKFIK